ncbi:MMPL family transporter [Agrilactobacillus fermenti]|uniref:MMPL family transporter n=1 Tax=Agrilactobacillus fermenti TaxID=2586909 RepID=UPI003A5BE3FC
MRRFLHNHVGSLVAWIILVIAAVLMLPNISGLIRDKGQTKIPDTAQSQVANAIQKDWGRGQGNTRQIVAVFNNGNKALTPTQKENIETTIHRLDRHAKKYGIKSITAPNDNAETKKQLISKDKSTQIVQILVAKDHGTVNQVNQELSSAVRTAGVKSYVTGADILNEEFSQKTQRGIQKTEVIAAIFIFIVLIIVFRSPIVPLISLLTVGVSFIVSLSIVMNLVQYFNFPLSDFTQVFIVIVLFGIGTDYNILLYDQFKEELAAGYDNWTATKRARKTAGKTILYSGSSVLIGFTALGLAKFSIYQSGLGVAVGVAVLLVVLLTLNPFFMTWLGKRMFWPAKNFSGHSTSKFWNFLSEKSIFHPIVSLLLVLLVTVPFIFNYNSSLDYDNLHELGNDVPAKQGFDVVQKHFSKGTAEPTTLYIQSNKRLNQEEYLKTIDDLTQSLQKEPGVKTVASVTQPGGSKIKALYVKDQVHTLGKGLSQGQKGLGTIHKGLNGATEQLGQNNGQSALTGVSSLIDGTNQLTNGSQQLTGGIDQLQAGSQQLATGMNALSQQLSAQLTGSNANQIQALQQGLPQINAGIQQLNQALQNNGAAGIDTSVITDNLGNVATQAQSIGNNVQAAGQTLSALQSAGTGSADSSQAVQQILAAAQANNAQLTDAQMQILSQAMASGLASATTQQTAGLKQQLQSVAANLQQAGAADQSLGQSLTAIQQSGLQTQVQQSEAQLAQLKTQVAYLAQNANVALPGAATALNQLSSGLTQVQTAVGQANTGASQLSNGTSELASQAPQLTTGLGTLQNGQQQLYTGLQQSTAMLGQLRSGLGSAANGVQSVNSGLGSAHQYMNQFDRSQAAESFYIPKNVLEGKTFKQALNNYMSSDYKTTKLTIVLDDNPSSAKAMSRIDQMSTDVKSQLKGTPLHHAKTAFGGQTSTINDTYQISSSDFLRTAAIMIIGISLALIFVTRSLLQPIYIIGTLLLAYFTSLSLTREISKLVLGQADLTWNTPFFTFIMLIALGVDYSIFLMMKYRELKENPKFDIGFSMNLASEIIGAVVISAAIILAGTFAALIPSGVLTLIQVAIGVMVGLAILVIIIPIMMSATIKLTYDSPLKGFSFKKHRSDSDQEHSTVDHK